MLNVNCETTRFSRGLVALVLGYVAVGIVEWTVLDFESAPLAGTTTLLVFGVLYLSCSILAFFAVSAVESAAIDRGLPVSRAVDFGYEVTTAIVLYGAGAMVGYWLISVAVPRTDHAFEFALVAGVVGVIIGEYLLRRGRRSRNRSARV
jgi:hypothetical protein